MVEADTAKLPAIIERAISGIKFRCVDGTEQVVGQLAPILAAEIVAALGIEPSTRTSNDDGVAGMMDTQAGPSWRFKPETFTQHYRIRALEARDVS